MIMRGTRSVEDRENGPLQGERRSQEVLLPAAAVKYMERSGLMRFNKTDPTWLWLEIPLVKKKSLALQSFCECDHTDESH